MLLPVDLDDWIVRKFEITPCEFDLRHESQPLELMNYLKTCPWVPVRESLGGVSHQLMVFQ